MQSSQSFLALGHLHLHPCGYLRSLTGAGNPLAQAYHRAPAHSSPTTGPSFKTLSEPRQNFLGGTGLHLGLGHVAFACAADTTKLATPGTCGCIFAAALLLPNQGQTNALDPITTQKKGDGFG